VSTEAVKHIMEHPAMIESISAITLATHDMSRSVDTISIFRVPTQSCEAKIF
jgi:hypothetical protein